MTEPFSPTSPLVIDCCGDSTMAGWADAGTQADPAATAPPPGFVKVPGPQGLAGLLVGRYGPSVQVNNLGKSGTTAVNWRDGTGGVPAPWGTYLAATKAAVIVMGLGINDSLADLQAIYPDLAGMAVLAGKRFIVQTPNVIDFPGIDTTLVPKVEYLRQLAVAQSYPLIDFNAATGSMGPGWFQDLSYSVVGGYPAGVHPNQAGYTLMAAVMDATVDPIAADLLGAPHGSVRTANPLPGMLLTAWDAPGMTVVNILPETGPGFWDGKPASPGIDFATGGPQGNRVVFALPAGRYRVELAGFWDGAWLPLDLATVTVS